MSDICENLNVEQLDGLIDIAGTDGVQEIFDAFFRSTADLVEQLSAHCRDNAFDQAASAAHSLKGSAANVGATKIAETALVLELAAKSCDEAAFENTMKSLNAAVKQARTQFGDHLAKRAAA